MLSNKSVIVNSFIYYLHINKNAQLLLTKISAFNYWHFKKVKDQINPNIPFNEIKVFGCFRKINFHKITSFKKILFHSTSFYIKMQVFFILFLFWFHIQMQQKVYYLQYHNLSFFQDAIELQFEMDDFYFQ